MASEVGDGFGSVDFWHTNIADDDIEEKPVFARVNDFNRFLTVLRFENFIAGLLQRHLHDFANIRLVVYYVHPSLAGFSSDKKS